MLITWDESKRKANYRRHGLDFADAAAVFGQYTYTREGTRYHCNERRYSTTGLLGELLVVIVHTERRRAIHAISFRRATRHEAREFWSRLVDDS
jgi:uncharacterized DUF497 family protein